MIQSTVTQLSLFIDTTLISLIAKAHSSHYSFRLWLIYKKEWYAKQKHLRCNKLRSQSEETVNDYTCDPKPWYQTKDKN